MKLPYSITKQNVIRLDDAGDGFQGVLSEQVPLSAHGCDDHQSFPVISLTIIGGNFSVVCS